MEKMTQKDMFNEIIALAKENGRSDIVEFATGRIEQLAKKTASRKPSADKAENIALANRVLDVLATSGGKMRASEILATDAVAFKSTSKVTALLKILVADGRAEKVTEKGVSLYYAV